MPPRPASRFRPLLIWTALASALVLPIWAAATSPLLAWRDPVYVVAGFAGIVAMALLLIQPLLAGGHLPGVSILHSRRVHRWTGFGLVFLVIVHIAGLWVTSPPDVVDALFFRSPTPFSAWGVVAMWALFISAFMVTFRRRLRLRPQAWRLGHMICALVIVAGSVGHAALVEGAMEVATKSGLAILIIIATVKVVAASRAWTFGSHLRARR